MARKSKLLTALDAHRGRDYEAEKQKKQVKAAEKRKRERAAKKTETNGYSGSEGDHSNQKPSSASPEATAHDDFAAFSDDEDDGVEIQLPRETSKNETLQNGQSQEQEDSVSGEEEESDVPFSDLEDEDMEDTIPHQRLTINNGPALIASCNSISIIKTPKTPFHYHNSLVSALPPSTDSISDPNDDLNRELEFYRIARDAAVEARSLLKKEKIPFTRPKDYFAEMVKSDEHMGKVKQKLYREAAGKKAAEEARKLRDAKKFGKAVQVAKEQQRAKEKRETLEKIKELKRKRKGNDTGKVTEGEGGGGDDDLFEKIDVENKSKKDRYNSNTSRGGMSSNPKRQKRNEKFGYGGKKRFSKSGDAVSSADLSGFSPRGMKDRGNGRGKQTTKRLGKSRRAAAGR